MAIATAFVIGIIVGVLLLKLWKAAEVGPIIYDEDGYHPQHGFDQKLEAERQARHAKK
jgi:hypothetical protein